MNEDQAQQMLSQFHRKPETQLTLPWCASIGSPVFMAQWHLPGGEPDLRFSMVMRPHIVPLEHPVRGFLMAPEGGELAVMRGAFVISADFHGAAAIRKMIHDSGDRPNFGNVAQELTRVYQHLLYSLTPEEEEDGLVLSTIKAGSIRQIHPPLKVAEPEISSEGEIGFPFESFFPLIGNELPAFEREMQSSLQQMLFARSTRSIDSQTAPVTAHLLAQKGSSYGPH